MILVQHIGTCVATLVSMLDKLDKTCEAVAAFWTNQGSKMKPVILRTMKDAVVKKSIPFWTEAKEEMDRYANTISVVDRCFNFVTNAKQSSTKSIELPTLQLTLYIPSNISTGRITGE